MTYVECQRVARDFVANIPTLTAAYSRHGTFSSSMYFDPCRRRRKPQPWRRDEQWLECSVGFEQFGRGQVSIWDVQDQGWLLDASLLECDKAWSSLDRRWKVAYVKAHVSELGGNGPCSRLLLSTRELCSILSPQFGGDQQDHHCDGL